MLSRCWGRENVFTGVSSMKRLKHDIFLIIFGCSFFFGGGGTSPQQDYRWMSTLYHDSDCELMWAGGLVKDLSSVEMENIGDWVCVNLTINNLSEHDKKDSADHKKADQIQAIHYMIWFSEFAPEKGLWTPHLQERIVLCLIFSAKKRQDVYSPKYTPPKKLTWQ